MSEQTDLIAHRGDQELYEITVLQADGSPLNLSTVQAIWFTAKRSYADLDADAIIVKTLDTVPPAPGGITITDGPAGKARITVDEADTAGLAPRLIELVYDVQVRDSAGNIGTPIRGTLTIEPDVTLSS